MKLWERVVEARLRKVVEICEQQYGFMPRKSTTDAIFALRILMEKYRDGQRELHCVFVDLEKAYDRVPREELWYCMRKSGVAEKYVRVVQDMYERSRTVVRCAVGQTEEFNVEVGLHQGSALSPFLFAIVMDQLSEEVRQESPWTMMFADDIVICSESREQVEENLERWRFALERRGMKVSRSKTEYMCVNEREGSGTVRLQGEEVKKVQDFKSTWGQQSRVMESVGKRKQISCQHYDPFRPENLYLPGARSVCDCPSKQSSTAIAKKMVAKYPASLQDVIEGDIVGSGYHSLVKQMQNRIENVKRPNVRKIRKRSRTEDSDTEEIPAERKAAVQDTYGCVNWDFKLMPLNETKESQLDKQERMKIKSKTTNADPEVSNFLKATYFSQRKDINNGASIQQLCENWPFLFQEI
ncbi:hypothetical protein QTP70_019449, partial [Hemibagrus guttatus]